MPENEALAVESDFDEPRASFLHRLLRILVAAAIGNVLLAAGAFLMRIDSRPACLGGLAVVFVAPFAVFLVSAWQMSAPPDARRALWTCAPIWMVAPPMASWLCELLYWHFGTTGTILAFAVVLPVLSAVVSWWTVDCLRRGGLWIYCRRPVALILSAFAALWLVHAFQLATVSLSWNIVPLPKVNANSVPASISRLLTAFLPTTFLFVFVTRTVVHLGRRKVMASESR
ncbi:MAG: hypothetical protein GXP25_08725 [Planctomycetes bacterium]|nr:hypothetical protein [Planctomycetota bacterium]